VRGVAVDQILRNLMEMQLVKIVGRSELPGRPMLYGSTQKFLEHFGINNLNDLPGVEELRRLEMKSQKEAESEEQEAVFEEGEAEELVDSETEAKGE